MEKQTKILIGVGAVIAAYLILKPKKAVAAAPMVPIPQVIESGTYDKPNPNDINDIFKYFHTCWDGYRTNNPREDCKTRGGYNTGPIPIKNTGSLQMERQCITYPC
jgi:hypothetical protein